jgi:hypothetical protein
LYFDSNLSLNQLKWKFLSLCLLLPNLLMQKPANVSQRYCFNIFSSRTCNF